MIEGLSFKDLYIAYHLVRGKPVMKKVSFMQEAIGDQITYWVKFEKQHLVVDSNYLKTNFDCKVKRYFYKTFKE